MKIKFLFGVINNDWKLTFIESVLNSFGKMSHFGIFQDFLWYVVFVKKIATHVLYINVLYIKTMVQLLPTKIRHKEHKTM